MIRKLFIYLLTIMALNSCNNNEVQISGTLEGSVSGQYLFLDELMSNDLISIDSVQLSEDGNFTFKRKIKSSSFYLLKVDQNNFLTMLIEPGEKITVNASFDSLNYPQSVSGSRGTELMDEYNKKLRQTIEQLTGLNNTYMENVDSPNLPAVIESLDSLAQNILDEINTYTKRYIDNNLSSLVSLVALYQQVAPSVYVMNPTKDLNYFIKVDSSLAIHYPDYEPVVALHEQVQDLVASLQGPSTTSTEAGSGNEAPEISLPSPEGDTISLSSTKGSIVLLDFWAAWCAPCRQENPNLVKAYDKYHSKGFEIFQVSLDKTKEAWMKGIKDDHLEKWIHVSDIQYWNSIVVPLYKIESIPANFLLDKNGRIIASNLRGAQLQTKLEELFN